MLLVLVLLTLRNVDKQLFELVHGDTLIHAPLRLILQELLHHLLLVLIPVLAHFSTGKVLFLLLLH